MSHQDSGPRNYIHKSLHNQIVEKLESEKGNLLKVLDNTEGYYRRLVEKLEGEKRDLLEVLANKEDHNRRFLETISGMAGNPDAADGCRLIIKRIRDEIKNSAFIQSKN